MVDQELEFAFEDLMNRDDLIERDITLSCVSNQVGDTLASTARWIGVPLKTLLDEAGVKSGSDQLVSRSVDGMTIGTATDIAMDTEDAMIAIGMNGEPLLVDHGFPARMLIPGQYGYISACKWIIEIEVTTFDAFDAYWVERDWDREAPIKVFSRIDTPQGLRPVKSGPRIVAGIAWAQGRGIAKVEVKIDDADWAEAELSPEVNKNLWRQWTYPVDFAAGPHKIVVRATDQNGELQTEERVPPFPNGATGWHNIIATISDDV
jgi:DMSO/TMAO reductase YedYZ molybdopterin-dependent catalytic subunit